MKDYFYQLITGQKKGLLAAVLKFILWILSLLYGVLLGLAWWLYEAGILKSYKLNAPVISVGNITWGGTGKTPVVKLLVRHLTGQGIKPAVLIRGYKSRPGLKSKDSNYLSVGDEAYMLAQDSAVPVLTGKDRVKSGRQALSSLAVNTLILDDGLQHRRIKRDLEITVIDCTNPFGDGFLIPRGILREPLSGLKRAEVFFLTKTDLATGNAPGIIERLKSINPPALIVESVHRPVGFYNLFKREEFISADKLKGEKIALACSIGNPQAFEETVRSLGLNPALKFFFIDHHHYRQKDVDKIIESCNKAKTDILVITRKDAVRLKDYFTQLNPSLKIMVLQIEISITKGKDEFFNRLSRLYAA